MNPLELLPASVSETVGLTLLHSLWQITVVAALFAVARRAVASARARHGLGVGALLLCLALPLATAFVLSPWFASDRTDSLASARAPAVRSVAENGTGVEPERSPTNSNALPILGQEVVTDRATAVPEGAAPSSASEADLGFSFQVPEAFARPLRAWTPWIALAWLAGVTLLSVRPLLGRWALQGLLRASDGEAPRALRRRVTELARQLGVRRAIRVLVRAKAQVPMLVGWLRPVILLPMSACTGLSSAELDTLLLHELAHLRRLDPLVRALQTTAETLLYFHPATWWISRVVRDEREKCCDDLVVATSRDRVSYVRALLRLEETRLSAASGALAATDGSLLDRARRIALPESAREPAAPSWTFAPLLAGVLVLLGTPWALNAGVAAAPDQDRIEIETIDPLLALERARALDEDTFRAFAAALRAEHRGSWMVIVDGMVLGPFDEFEDAVAQSDRSHPDALHRFVFRPGIDDQDVTFQLSPWVGDSSHWFQLGRAFHQRAELTISADEWVRGSQRVGTPEGRGRIEVSAPGGDTSVAMQCVVSQMLEHDQTIGEEVVQELGLERFAVPGLATGTGPRPFRKVRAMVHVPGLHLDLPTVAIVIPLEFTAHDAEDLRVDEETELGFEIDEVGVDDEIDEVGTQDELEEVGAENTARVVFDVGRPDVDGRPFVVYGRVTREDGAPLANATVEVRDGSGTLLHEDGVITDELGLYRLDFAGMAESPSRGEPSIDSATVSVTLEGFRVVNEAAASLPHFLTRGVPARMDFVLEDDEGDEGDEIVEIDVDGGN